MSQTNQTITQHVAQSIDSHKSHTTTTTTLFANSAVRYYYK